MTTPCLIRNLRTNEVMDIKVIKRGVLSIPKTDTAIGDEYAVLTYKKINMYGILQNIPIRGNYKKGKIEKGFQSEVFSYLRNREYFCYHIADIGMGYRLLDAYILDPQGNQFLIEFKKTDGLTFNLSQFEPSQIELLDLMQERGALSYIMVYSQKTNTYWVGQYSYLKSNANSKGGIKLF